MTKYNGIMANNQRKTTHYHEKKICCQNIKIKVVIDLVMLFFALFKEISYIMLNHAYFLLSLVAIFSPFVTLYGSF